MPFYEVFKTTMIYFLFQSFSGVFQNAVINTERSRDLAKHIIDLTDTISYDTFVYVSKGLFQTDKLMFLFLMTVQVEVLSWIILF